MMSTLARTPAQFVSSGPMRKLLPSAPPTGAYQFSHPHRLKYMRRPVLFRESRMSAYSAKAVAWSLAALHESSFT